MKPTEPRRLLLLMAACAVTLFRCSAQTVDFDSSTYTVSEGGSAVALCLASTPNATSDFTVTIDFTSGEISLGNMSLDFTVGDAERCTTVSAVDDDDVEASDTVTLTLITTETNVTVSTAGANVTVEDNDMATFQFENPSYAVTEGAVPVEVCVTTTSTLERAVTVTLTVTPVSASDYSVSSPNITFNAGDSRVCADVTIVDDMVVEATETAALGLTSADSSAVTTDTATLEITDDDTAVATFSEASYTVAEADGTVEVCVDVSTVLARSVNAVAETVNGSAVAGEDFTQVTAAALSFNASTNRSCLSISILSDNNLESTESFSVSVTSSDFTSPITALDVSITDSSSATAALQNLSYTVPEGAVVPVCVVLTAGQAESPVLVTLTPMAGSASGTDFNQSSVTVAIQGTSGCGDIETLGDTDNEVDTEMFTVVLTSTDTRVSVDTSADTATITILDPPTITTQPLNQTGHSIGANVSFTVVAMGTSLSYQWRRNGEDLSDDSTYSGTATPTLMVEDAMAEQMGEYTCLIANEVGQVPTDPATLSFLGVPVISPLQQAVEEGEDVAFTCSASGTDLTFIWASSTGLQLPDAADTDNTSTLTLPGVNTSYTGQYWCRVAASNTEQMSPLANLIVIAIANISSSYPSPVPHGVVLDLTCNAEGAENFTHNITYRWERDPWLTNTTLDRVSGLTSPVLEIMDVQSNDRGTYTCTVGVDDEEVGSRNFTLDTQGVSFINNLPSAVDVREGELLSLNVTVQYPQGSPTTQFRWYLNGVALQDTRRITIINRESPDNSTGTSISTLTISDVMRNESGDYIVRAYSSQPADGVISNTSVVTVLHLPNVTLTGDSPVNVGDNLELTCEADATPPVFNLTILRGGTALTNCENASGVVGLVCTVMSVGLEDTGDYTCVGNNTLGGGDDTLEITVQGVPEPVDHSTIQDTITSLRTVDLTWEEPGNNNGPIRMYNISYCTNAVNGSCSEPGENSRMTQGPEPRYTLEGLDPGKVYTLTIEAVNDVGASPRNSNTTYEFPTATQANVTPVNLRVGQVTESLVFLLWDISAIAESSDGGGYTVTYNRVGSPTSESLVNATGSVILALEAGTAYNFRVVANFLSPEGFESDEAALNASTEASDYVPSDSVTHEIGADNDIVVGWPAVTPEDGREFLQRYRIDFTSVPRPTSVRRRKRQSASPLYADPDETSVTLDPVPYSDNTVMVTAEFEADGTPFTALITAPTIIQSNEEAPSEPRNLIASNESYRSVNLRWKLPAMTNGIISLYRVTYGSPPVTVLVPNYTPGETFNLTDLEPNTRYTISVTAATAGGEGPASGPEIVMTLWGIAQPLLGTVLETTNSRFFVDGGAVINEFPGLISYYKYVVVRDTAITDTENNVREDQLRSNTGEDAYYQIAGNNYVRSVSPSVLIGDGETTPMFMGETYTNPVLEIDRDYYLFIRVFSEHDATVYRDSALSNRFGFESEDDDELDPIPIIVPIAVVAALLLIVFVVLLVVAFFTRRPKVSRRHVFNDGSVDGKRGRGVELRRTRIFSPVLNVGSPDVFTSAGQPTTLLCEASGTPAPEVHWTKDGESLDKERFIQLADSSLFIYDTDLQDEGQYLVTAANSAGSAEQMVQVTVIRPVPPEPDSEHPPIKMGDFSEKLARLRLNDDEGLDDEYADLELDWNFTSYAAKLSVNKNKNRYVNIIPYDHSRATLSLQDHTPGSDYLNGSYIDGYNRPNAYIATQGPIPSTFPDFWRIVWELDCPTIVMVTNLKEDEKIKCNQYWPSYGTTTYGNVQVTLKEVENLAEYSIRTFNVSPLAGQSKAQMPVREVRQFHFVVWPDHGVPQYATALLSFRKRVHKYHPDKRGPTVVHCSAGVGRTGTYITIDYTLKQIEAEGVIDIFNFVRHMRYRRNYMVQTSPQYVFIYEAILEAIMCGDTSIAAPELKKVILSLQEVDTTTGKTGIQQQFETLTKASPADEEFDCTVAQLVDNMAKNRFKQHLPPNEFRVILSSENDQSDYICASFVDGYRQRNAFITTQVPMDTTIGDFWRMVWEHKSAAIVMLMEIEEGGGVVKYWPGEVGQPESYGHYQVELSADERDVGDYTTRRFKLSPVDQPQESRWITQFHFQRWPKSSCPTNAKSIIDLIDELQRVQRKSGNGPITVHCDDGIGRTGTFCALYSVLERVKIEQVVDVFQSIKTVRIQRPGLLETQDQFDFIYKAVLEFLDSFSDYQNFK